MKKIKANPNYALMLLLFLAAGFTAPGAMAQFRVTGTVTDASDRTTLPGVNIQVQGTSTGTVTDIDGNYELNVPSEESVLLFSFVGYQTIEMPVDGRSEINVAMMMTASQLEEMVVVGYSTIRKQDLTGAVSVVDIGEMENTPYANVIQALQGRVSGVTITQDGQPGTGRTRMTIRGLSTINNNAPLYVIDGIATTEGLDNLNPNDIESIQILKDAASASIYGSRSAGGVVIITTKKGEEGQMRVNAGYQFGLQTLANKIDVLDAQQWGEVYWTAAQNSGITPDLPTMYGSGPQPVISTSPFIIPNQRQIYQYSETGTDWYDEVYRNAPSQQYFVNFANGNDKGNYFFGLSYFDQEGLIRNTNYGRVTVRANTEFDITDWIKVGENLSVSTSNQVQIGSQQGHDGIPLDVIRQHPLLPVFDVRGNYAGRISGFPDVRNMVSVLEKNKDNTTQGNRVFGNAFFEANIFNAFDALEPNHDLIFNSTFGIDYNDYYDRRFEAAFSEGDYDITGNALTNNYGTGNTRTFTNTLEYGFTNERHNFKLLGGIEMVEHTFKFLSGRRSDFEIEDPFFTYLNAGAGTQTNAGGGTEWGLYSTFGRLDYTFDNKYIISATLRKDETSRLNTYGTFPAASLGWRVTQEPFVQSFLENAGLNEAISDLKIRGSYGEQGNQFIGDFATLSIFGPDINHSNYDLLGTNTDVLQGYSVLSRGNPNLKWETLKQFNAGIDLSLFNDMFTLSADYYIKNTEDVLRQLAQIAAIGEGAPPWVNAAKMRNTGVDINLGYNYLNPTSEFSFSSRFTLDMYRNEVVSLGEGANVAQVGYDGELYIDGFDGPTRITVGQPFGVFYGYMADGIFQNDDEVNNHADQPGAAPGRIRYKDINGDGVVDEQDRTYIGSPHPKASMGMFVETG
ncbi:MAG: SusC/RagA family TonB-linked outer membrane protein, partial [Bacteroidota bacterium]